MALPIVPRLRWFVAAVAVALLVAVSLVAAISSLFLFDGGASADVTLQGVPPEALAEQGISLSPVDPSTAMRLSPQQAREVAEFPDAQVRQIVPARLKGDQAGKTLDRVVWVVSLEPGNLGLPAGPGDGTGSPVFLFYLVFIDGNTGEYLFGSGAGGIQQAPQ